jgi:hypothetical protein
MDQNWEVKAIEQDVVGKDRGALVLEWTLNQRPDPEWTQFFINSDVQKNGSATFVFSRPSVSGNKIRMHAEDIDIEAAARYVEESILRANKNFDARILTKRRREAEAQQQHQAKEADQIADARDRLRRASSSGSE